YFTALLPLFCARLSTAPFSGRSAAHRDPDRSAREVGRPPDDVLDPPALREVELLLPVADEREGRRGDRGLRHVVDAQAHPPDGLRRRVPERPAEDPVELARRDPPPPVVRRPLRRLEDAAHAGPGERRR